MRAPPKRVCPASRQAHGALGQNVSTIPTDQKTAIPFHPGGTPTVDAFPPEVVANVERLKALQAIGSQAMANGDQALAWSCVRRGEAAYQRLRSWLASVGFQLAPCAPLPAAQQPVELSPELVADAQRYFPELTVDELVAVAQRYPERIAAMTANLKAVVEVGKEQFEPVRQAKARGEPISGVARDQVIGLMRACDFVRDTSVSFFVDRARSARPPVRPTRRGLTTPPMRRTRSARAPRRRAVRTVARIAAAGDSGDGPPAPAEPPEHRHVAASGWAS